MGDLFASLNEKNISISESAVTSMKMAQLIDCISKGIISGRTAKEVFEIMKETGEEPKKIIESIFNSETWYSLESSKESSLINIILYLFFNKLTLYFQLHYINYFFQILNFCH